jgi:hypothetical protein
MNLARTIAALAEEFVGKIVTINTIEPARVITGTIVGVYYRNEGKSFCFRVDSKSFSEFGVSPSSQGARYFINSSQFNDLVDTVKTPTVEGMTSFEETVVECFRRGQM